MDLGVKGPGSGQREPSGRGGRVQALKLQLVSLRIRGSIGKCNLASLGAKTLGNPRPQPLDPGCLRVCAPLGNVYTPLLHRQIVHLLS